MVTSQLLIAITVFQKLYAPTSYTRFLIRLLILVYGVHAFSYNFADVDLWGHLKFGQEHYQTGSLAATDPFRIPHRAIHGSIMNG